METTPVVVHLIHGTWPYGIFRRSHRKDSIPAWFEDGSMVRRRIRGEADVPIDYRVFHWSGKNSIASRRSAAIELYRYLDEALKERADTKHVLIAHSHGGTVAAQCLSGNDPYSPITSRINAVIFIASPFTYLHVASDAENTSFRIQIAKAITRSIAVWFIFRSPAMSWLHAVSLGAITGTTSWMIAMVVLPLITKREPSGGYQYHAIPRRIPTFVLRGTRDEAALVLGLTQAVNMLLNRLSVSEERRAVQGAFRKLDFPRVVVSILAGVPFATGIIIAFWGILNIPSLMLLSGFAGELLYAILTILAYAGVALSVGFYDVRAWTRTTIEVDAAPQMKEVAFKSYSDIDELETTSLRHGLYENKAVQGEIARVIAAVYKGDVPKLVSEGELEDG